MGKNVLIIGAGPAGLAAAEAAASMGAAVTLVGEESYPPYWRPRLPGCLSGPVPVETLSVRKPDWYARNGIQLITSRAAERIDPAGKSVFWAQGAGSSIYDSLVIATGSSPVMPPIAGAEHALVFRTYDDAVRIREAALAAGRATVIGGGLLGLETAWELNRAGIAVTLVERNGWLLPKQLNREGGLYLQRRLESSGIGFVIGRNPSSLQELYRGACAVVAAGVRANLPALEGSGITANRGVIVDGRMRTSAENVYACGDVAEYGGHSWGLLPVAQEQGKVAGTNAAGGDVSYTETPPSPVMKAGPVSVFSVGDMSEGEGAKILSGESENGYACLALKGGILAGAALVGDTKAGMKLKKAFMDKRRFESKNIKELLEQL